MKLRIFCPWFEKYESYWSLSPEERIDFMASLSPIEIESLKATGLFEGTID